MLKRLSLQNFKSWAVIDNMKFAPITGLFGANSSGKSSLIQLFLMLKQTAASPDRAQVLNLGDERSLISLGTFRDVIHKHGEAGEFGQLGCRISWTLPKELRVKDPEQEGAILFAGDEMGFSVDITENGTGRMIVNNIHYDFAGYSFALQRKSKKEGKYELSATPDTFRFRRTQGRAWDLPSPVKCYGFPEQVKAYYQNAGFLADFELAFEQLFSRIYYLGPLREYPQRQYTWAGAQPADMGQRGEKAVDALLASRDRGEKISRGAGRGKHRLTVEEYVALWLRELGLIDSFEVEAITKDSNLYRVWVKKAPKSSRVLITDVGFGVSQLLPVLVLCYYVPKGSTILLEQPELHLHPSVQSGLADVFIDVVKKRNVQVIFESHSEHLLRRLQRRIADKKISSEDAALCFCDVSSGVSKLVPLELNLFGEIYNWPDDFFGDEYGEIAAIARAKLARQAEKPL